MVYLVALVTVAKVRRAHAEDDLTWGLWPQCHSSRAPTVILFSEKAKPVEVSWNLSKRALISIVLALADLPRLHCSTYDWLVGS